MKTGSVQSFRNLWGDGGSLFAGRRKTAGSAINEGEGPPNQRNYAGCEPRILLFRVPDLGILRKMADDVRRRSVIWEIADQELSSRPFVGIADVSPEATMFEPARRLQMATGSPQLVNNLQKFECGVQSAKHWSPGPC